MNHYNLSKRKERIDRAKRYRKMLKSLTVKQLAEAEGISRQAVEKVLKVLQ